MLSPDRHGSTFLRQTIEAGVDAPPRFLSILKIHVSGVVRMGSTPFESRLIFTDDEGSASVTLLSDATGKIDGILPHEPAGMAKVAGQASLSAPGWLGLGYTFNVTGTVTGRMVWLFVRQIAPGGPAERAGLRTQDVITTINGNEITFSDELDTLNFFNGIRAGQPVQLKVAVEGRYSP